MKKTLAVVLIIAFAIAGYFVYQAFLDPVSVFKSNYSAISAAWKDVGFEEEKLHANPSVLGNFTENQLNEIKSNLAAIDKGSLDGASKELIGVYVDYIDLILQQKKVVDLDNDVSFSEEEFCEDISDYEALAVEMKTLNDLTVNFSKKLNSFVLSYPEQTAEIELYGIDFIEEISEENIQSLLNLIVDSKEICGELNE